MFSAEAENEKVPVDPEVKRSCAKSSSVLLPNDVPSGSATAGRAARWWNGGPDGRALIDRICERAPRQLRRGGTLLIVQSAVSGVQATLDALRAQGMTASVAARRTQPYGPVLRARAAELEAAGLARPGGRSEELVVVRADRN